MPPRVHVFLRATLKDYRKSEYRGVINESLQTDDKVRVSLSSAAFAIFLFLSDFYLNTGVLAPDRMFAEMDKLIQMIDSAKEGMQQKNQQQP